MNKQKIANTDKGITLIALIITIIVMLILVSVTISMAINGGLFQNAGDAVEDTQNAIDAEQILASGTIHIDGVWYDSMDDYIEGIPGKKNWPIKWNGLEVSENTSIIIDEISLVKISDLMLTVEDFSNLELRYNKAEEEMVLYCSFVKEFKGLNIAYFMNEQEDFCMVSVSQGGYNEEFRIDIPETGLYVMNTSNDLDFVLDKLEEVIDVIVLPKLTIVTSEATIYCEVPNLSIEDLQNTTCEAQIYDSDGNIALCSELISQTLDDGRIVYGFYFNDSDFFITMLMYVPRSGYYEQHEGLSSLDYGEMTFEKEGVYNVWFSTNISSTKYFLKKENGETSIFYSDYSSITTVPLLMQENINGLVFNKVSDFVLGVEDIDELILLARDFSTGIISRKVLNLEDDNIIFDDVTGAIMLNDVGLCIIPEGGITYGDITLEAGIYMLMPAQDIIENYEILILKNNK